MTAGQLILWRHGQTSWNAEERMQGQTDVPLDDVGFAQARDAAARLAALSPVMIFSSDLSRASQTADALAVRTGLPVTLDPRLREIDGGSLSGLTRSEFLARYPGLRLGADPDEPRGGDGETERQVATRVAAALRDAADAAPDGSTIVVATHGVSSRVGAGELVGLPPECWRALAGVANCCWVALGQVARTAPAEGLAAPVGPGASWRIVEWNAGSLPEPLFSDDGPA